MISAQIDELRNAAEFYDGCQAANLMRDAADTIWQLRDDLQRANDAVRDAEHDESRAWDRVRKAEAENAKLREQSERLFDKTLELATENSKLRELCKLCEREDENAKLRELVRDYERCTMHADCSMCEYDGKLSTHCPLSPCFPDADELCELGIEVDG